MEGSMIARRVALLVLAVVMSLVAPARAGAGRPRPLTGTVEALLALEVRPVAIGHRGYGAEDPRAASRPGENTVAAVRAAFLANLTVIEIDVQLTRDRHVVAYHDDVLPDSTCVNQLTVAELQARLPQVPTLAAVLHEARRFNRPSGPLRGLVIIELKAARPLCDPRDRQDRPVVDAAVRAVRQARMEAQVLFTSFSPALLDLARLRAPDIARILAVSALQFLDQATVEEMFDTTVRLVEKDHGLGLQWGEIGDLYRLPGYRSVPELLDTARALDVRVVEADLPLLAQTGAALVQLLHSSGLEVFGFTVETAAQWSFLESLGVDGIYTNDIPLGLAAQAPVP
jgi:glycerophosphoryl diester phosphodiesterase